MIEIELCHQNSGFVTGFTVSGHAQHSTKGKDIVCAAVSALTQGAILGLTEYLKLTPLVMREDGYLRCSLTVNDAASSEVQAILRTMGLALLDIADGYPQRVRVKEVQSQCL